MAFCLGGFDMSCGLPGTVRMLYDLDYPQLDDAEDSEQDRPGLDRQASVDGDGARRARWETSTSISP